MSTDPFPSARSGDWAFAVPGSGPTVRARRRSSPSEYQGPAPPFQPAGAPALRSSRVRALRAPVLRSTRVRPLRSWATFY